MKIEKTVFVIIAGKILSSIIISLLCSTIYGQKLKKEVPPIKERLFYGGNFSLQIGSITNIELSPIVGFWVLPRLAVAAGPNYKYRKDYYGKTDIYGGRAYVQFVVIQDLNKFIPLGMNTSLFLHLEDEVLSLDSYHYRNVVANPKRFLINSVFAGAGLSQQIGVRSSVNLMVLWALNESATEVYSNPLFRIGFIF